MALRLIFNAYERFAVVDLTVVLLLEFLRKGTGLLLVYARLGVGSCVPSSAGRVPFGALGSPGATFALLNDQIMMVLEYSRVRTVIYMKQRTAAPLTEVDSQSGCAP